MTAASPVWVGDEEKIGHHRTQLELHDFKHERFQPPSGCVS